MKKTIIKLSVDEIKDKCSMGSLYGGFHVDLCGNFKGVILSYNADLIRVEDYICKDHLLSGISTAEIIKDRFVKYPTEVKAVFGSFAYNNHSNKLLEIYSNFILTQAVSRLDSFIKPVGKSKRKVNNSFYPEEIEFSLVEYTYQLIDAIHNKIVKMSPIVMSQESFLKELSNVSATMIDHEVESIESKDPVLGFRALLNAYVGILSRI